MNMQLVYTCSNLKCVIFCPCKICTDETVNCKLQCRAEVCSECNIQCHQHQVTLPCLFDVKVDNFTMRTQKMGKYQFAIPYAGIPLKCGSCSEEVLEHQVLHLVFHTRCRFCRFEMRPFEQKDIVTVEDYKKAEKILKSVERRTCCVCLVKCQDKFARLKHEESVHDGLEKQFKCKHCDKSYANVNAFKYHEDRQHMGAKATCDLCGFQCSSDGNLQRHIETLHAGTSTIVLSVGLPLIGETALNDTTRKNILTVKLILTT